MTQGLAIWHYPYRTTDENIRFFAGHGFTAISEHGAFFLDALRHPDRRARMAQALRDTGVVFTVHHYLPSPSMAYTAEDFRADMALARGWFDETGLLRNLSFDVPQDIRPRILPYLRVALEAFSDTGVGISVEDYGLTPEELADLAPLRGDPAFGYLLDLGHMNVRLTGQFQLFHCTALERSGEGAPLPAGDNSPQAFRNAILSKPFPVYEMHLHNNSGLADQHRPLDEGTIQMAGLAAVLRALDFPGVVTLETVPDWHGTPAEIEAQKAATDAFWQPINHERRVPVFTGSPDPLRDRQILRCFSLWRQALEA